MICNVQIDRLLHTAQFNTDSHHSHSHSPVPPAPEGKRRSIEENIVIMDRPGRSVTPMYAIMMNRDKGNRFVGYAES